MENNCYVIQISFLPVALGCYPRKEASAEGLIWEPDEGLLDIRAGVKSDLAFCLGSLIEKKTNREVWLCLVSIGHKVSSKKGQES